jgi:hypothetical protein
MTLFVFMMPSGRSGDKDPSEDRYVNTSAAGRNIHEARYDGYRMKPAV